MKDIIRIIPLLVAAIGLGGCIDEAELAYDQIEVKGADGGMLLQVEPLPGQGYRLSARVENVCGTMQEAGFHIEQSVSALAHHKTWRIPVTDLKDFSTIVNTDELFARQLWAYAYVICDSIEVQSQPLELRLANDVLPDSQPVVERVEISEPWRSDDYWGPTYYTVSLHGQGFVPFEGSSSQNPFFSTRYLRCEADADAYPLPIAATPTQLDIRLKLHSYNYPERIIWWQGTRSVKVSDLRVEAPNWLLPPSHSYRLGETFVPEFATEVGRDKVRLYDDSNYLMYGTSFSIVIPTSIRSFTFTQYYDHFPIHDRQLTIPISYPWQRVEGRQGYMRIARQRICTGHCVFAAEQFEGISWFDAETLSEHSSYIPFNSLTYIIASSDDPQSVVIINVGNKNDRHDLYRFTMADRRWTSLGSTPRAGTVRLAYERQGVLHEVLQSDGSWRLVKTDLTTLQTSSETLDLGVSSIDRFAGEYNGVLYYAKNRQLYAYDLAAHTYRQLPDLQAYNTWGDYYMAISGHWLYNGDAPTVRYDLDQPDMKPEFLGCPENGYHSSWTYPYGDDCYSAKVEYEGQKEVHQLYRFVEDR